MIKITYESHIGLLNIETNEVLFYNMTFKNIFEAIDFFKFRHEQLKKEEEIFNNIINSSEY